MTVQIEPIQAGTGDPSPSNVRAISGWTKASVRRTAKNLCGGEAFKKDLIKAMPNISLDETAKTALFHANATYTGSSLFDIKWKPQTQYTFIIAFSKSSNDATNMRIYYTDVTYENLGSARGSYNTKLIQAQRSSANKTISKVIKVYQSGATTLYYDECGVFEGVITADDFVSYNGNTYEIEFPDEAGTVYGGELVVNEDGSGTLTVTKGKTALSAIPKSVYGTYVAGGRMITSYFDHMTNVVAVDKKGILSNVMPVKRGAVPTTGSCIFVGEGATRTSFLVDQNDIGTGVTINVSNVNAWYDSIGAYAVYDLATHIVYQLTAEEVISTLKGLNNIWADTGDITVEYHADPTIVVEQKTKAIKQSIAYVQNDYTAVQPYVVNDLVYVGDTLYIVTSAIAQGATITPNTNCSETTLNAVIKSLR